MSKRTEVINSLISRYYYYWALAVLVVLGVVFWQGLFAHQYSSLQTSGVLQHDQLITTIAQREQYLQDLQTMKTNYAALDNRLMQELPVVLPENYTSADVFTEIEQLFSGTGLIINSVNVSSAAPAATVAAAEPSENTTGTENQTAGLNGVYQIVSITVSVSLEAEPGLTEGSVAALTYGEFKQVLQHLEEQRHLMNLEQMTYSPNTSNLTLILKTYQKL